MGNHTAGHLTEAGVTPTGIIELAQLPVNIFAEPLAVNSRISVCLVEKGMTMPGFGGNETPPDGGRGPRW